MAVGVLFGTVQPACGSSDQCPQAGMFCRVGGGDRCGFCGWTPLPAQTDPATGGAMNNPDAPGFAGFNLTAVAELCAGPSLYAGELQDRFSSRSTSSIVSWCKSGGDNAFGRLIPPNVRGA